MPLTNVEEVKDFIVACQDPDHLRVVQHMVAERLAMFNPPAGQEQAKNLTRPMVAAGPEGVNQQKLRGNQQQKTGARLDPGVEEEEKRREEERRKR